MYQNLEAINGGFREQREMQREIEEIVSFIIDIGGKKICCYRTKKSAEQKKFLELRGLVALWDS